MLVLFKFTLITGETLILNWMQIVGFVTISTDEFQPDAKLRIILTNGNEHAIRETWNDIGNQLKRMPADGSNLRFHER